LTESDDYSFLKSHLCSISAEKPFFKTPNGFLKYLNLIGQLQNSAVWYFLTVASVNGSAVRVDTETRESRVRVKPETVESESRPRPVRV